MFLNYFPKPWLISIRRSSSSPDNGAVHLGRGISKFYLGDKTGACEDWRTASARGAINAAELITEYCKE
jgi:hypothetical protein